MASLSVGCEQRVQMAPRQRPQPAPTQPTPSQPETTRPAPGGPEAQSQQLAQVEQEIFRRVNQQRREAGLTPLENNTRLRQLARDYSREMARESFFSHYSPSGESVVDRAQEAGLQYSYIGENIFKSVNAPLNRMPNIAVQGWMDSPGHRRNILREAFTEAGVGAWKQDNTVYVTQVFRRPR